MNINLTITAASVGELQEMCRAITNGAALPTPVARSTVLSAPTQIQVLPTLQVVTLAETAAREECAKRGIDPDEICADGGVLAWMIVDKEIQGAATAKATTPPSGAAPTPPKRARRTKAQIAADEEAARLRTLEAVEEAGLLDGDANSDIGDLEPSDDGDAFDLLGDTSEPSPPRVITQSDLMDAGRAVMNKSGPIGLMTILQKHGFKKVADVPEHSFAAVMADLEEAVGG